MGKWAVYLQAFDRLGRGMMTHDEFEAEKIVQQYVALQKRLQASKPEVLLIAIDRVIEVEPAASTLLLPWRAQVEAVIATNKGLS